MSQAGVRSPRKRKGQGAERREEILEAALSLFAERGVYGVSTREIAQAVGISQPTLYAYFENKDEIARELHNRAFAALAARLVVNGMPKVDSAEDLIPLLRLYVDFGLDQPNAYRLAFMAEAPLGARAVDDAGKLSPQAASTFGRMRLVIGDLHARGMTVDVDPDTLSQSTWASLHGLVSLLIVKPSFPWVDRERLIDGHLRLIARAILADIPSAAQLPEKSG